MVEPGRAPHNLRLGARTALYATALAAVVALVGRRDARADDPDPSIGNEACAIRLSIAILGKSPDAKALASNQPPAGIDAMLATPEFIENFARFTNAQLNAGPGSQPDEDPAYYLAKYVLENKRPWHEVFDGPYLVHWQGDATGGVIVEHDTPAATSDGLGYFHSPQWMKRYAGNEGQGVKLRTANHILLDTIGMALTPSVGKPDDDRTVTGRAVSPCRGCHFDENAGNRGFPLDKVAAVLSRRVDTPGMPQVFSPPSGEAQTFHGVLVHGDTELVKLLVSSPDFAFKTCRTAFRYLYGRDESQCDGPLFDQCVDAFGKDGTMQSALSVIAKDPSFCR